MKLRILALGLGAAMLLSLAACTPKEDSGSGEVPDTRTLVLSDSGITLDGETLTPEHAGDVTVSNDIVYYRDGTDDTYGEGTEDEMHSAEEAAAHTVVTIRKSGVYRVSGALSAGQLAIDLGDGAKRDPSAVVTLILDGVDITCTVAPAVIFYNVYECDTAFVAYSDGETEDYAASADVDTSAAGANVILADGSHNSISGSHVARIYKEGTTKKLHKYDGAFYSKMSMNISGETSGTGELLILADHEGLDSELHLTLNGGRISIQADNDGINTNEDGVSVTTINGGSLLVNGGTGDEGDGIDSNGWLVINGGKVVAVANGRSGDGGIDADMGILLNGGSVLALGSLNDTVDTGSAQAYMELSFAATQPADSVLSLRSPDGEELLTYTATREFATATISLPELELGVDYAVYVDGTQQQYTGHGFGRGGGMGGGQPPEDFQPGEPPQEPDSRPQGELPQEGQPPADGQAPSGDSPEHPRGSGDGQTASDRQPPSGEGQAPDGQMPQPPDGGFARPGGGTDSGEPSTAFTLTETTRSFSVIADAAS